MWMLTEHKGAWTTDWALSRKKTGDEMVRLCLVLPRQGNDIHECLWFACKRPASCVFACKYEENQKRLACVFERGLATEWMIVEARYVGIVDYDKQ